MTRVWLRTKTKKTTNFLKQITSLEIQGHLRVKLCNILNSFWTLTYSQISIIWTLIIRNYWVIQRQRTVPTFFSIIYCNKTTVYSNFYYPKNSIFRSDSSVPIKEITIKLPFNIRSPNVTHGDHDFFVWLSSIYTPKWFSKQSCNSYCPWNGFGSFRPWVVVVMSRFCRGPFRPGHFGLSRFGLILEWVVSAYFGGSFRSDISLTLPPICYYIN